MDSCCNIRVFYLVRTSLQSMLVSRSWRACGRVRGRGVCVGGGLDCPRGAPGGSTTPCALSWYPPRFHAHFSISVVRGLLADSGTTPTTHPTHVRHTRVTFLPRWRNASETTGHKESHCHPARVPPSHLRTKNGLDWFHILYVVEVRKH